MTHELGFSQSIAVLIGINRYQHDVPPLHSAINDVSRIAETLQQHGYRTVLLLDDEATRDALLDLIERQLPQQVGSDDRVLFYFAGHGVAKLRTGTKSPAFLTVRGSGVEPHSLSRNFRTGNFEFPDRHLSALFRGGPGSTLKNVETSIAIGRSLKRLQIRGRLLATCIASIQSMAIQLNGGS